MSKIICDVCGTTYPETSSQCPICGCVRPADNKAANGRAGNGRNDSSYQYVRGGRFSKSNVQKRNAKSQAVARNTTTAKVSKENHKNKTTRGLAATAVILVLAIIAVFVYICLRFFAPAFLENPQQLLPQETDAVQTQPSEPEVIPCESITLDVNAITLSNLGEARMLYATVLPEDTTDKISFTSDNEAVATVTEDGKVTAVAPGEATITVTCGDITQTCLMVCNYVEETQPTEAPTEETLSNEELVLNRTDITFGKKGESWLLYSGNIGKTEITWTTDDENVATIDAGKVVAVGGGTTTVYAEYNDQKVSCIIRCDFAAADNNGVDGNGGGITEDGGDTTNDSGITEDDGGSSADPADCQLYNPIGNAEDVSIRVGESFTLKLQDNTGNFVDAVWAVADMECCEISGTTFTGKSAGTTSITATYQGQVYTCVVRVSG